MLAVAAEPTEKGAMVKLEAAVAAATKQAEAVPDQIPIMVKREGLVQAEQQPKIPHTPTPREQAEMAEEE